MKMTSSESVNYCDQKLLSKTGRQESRELSLNHSSRYHKNPELPAIDYAQKYFLKVQDEQILTELESVRLRLELEADTQIEQAVSAFRARLQAAAHEEIEYILKNTKFKTSIQD